MALAAVLNILQAGRASAAGVESIRRIARRPGWAISRQVAVTEDRALWRSGFKDRRSRAVGGGEVEEIMDEGRAVLNLVVGLIVSGVSGTGIFS